MGGAFMEGACASVTGAATGRPGWSSTLAMEHAFKMCKRQTVVCWEVGSVDEYAHMWRLHHALRAL